MDTLPNNSFPLKKIPSNACKQAQYWEKVFELAGIPNDNNGDDHYAKSVSVFGVILVRIFLHLELIRRDSKYLSKYLPLFSLNVEKCGPKYFRIRALYAVDGADVCFDLDILIISLKEKTITEFGLIKYPMLLLLFKTAASLSHVVHLKMGFPLSSSLGFIETPDKLMKSKH